MVLSKGKIKVARILSMIHNFLIADSSVSKAYIKVWVLFAWLE